MAWCRRGALPVIKLVHGRERAALLRRLQGGRPRAPGRPRPATARREAREPARRGGPGGPSRVSAEMPMNRPTYAEACRTFRWEDSFKPGRAVYPGLEAEIVDVVKTHV